MKKRGFAIENKIRHLKAKPLDCDRLDLSVQFHARLVAAREPVGKRNERHPHLRCLTEDCVESAARHIP